MPSLFSKASRDRWIILHMAALSFIVVVQETRPAGAGTGRSQGWLSRTATAKAQAAKAIWGNGGRAVATSSDSVF